MHFIHDSPWVEKYLLSCVLTALSKGKNQNSAEAVNICCLKYLSSSGLNWDQGLFTKPAVRARVQYQNCEAQIKSASEHVLRAIHSLISYNGVASFNQMASSLF